MTLANFSYQNYICIVLKVLQAYESLKKHYFPYDNNLYIKNNSQTHVLACDLFDWPELFK